MLRLAAALCLVVAAAANAAPLICAPALPFYCANIHVGCAGRSQIAARAFSVSVDGAFAIVRRDDAAATYTVAPDRDRTILRPEFGEGWIRIDEDGRFAERIYRKSGALMSYGRCAPAE
ncbi:MAG: hypothetical protein AAF360_17795 [Pseudomonadota bacterium]